MESAKEEAVETKKQLVQLDRKTDQFLDRIADADSPIFVETYEKRIQDLQKQKIKMSANIRNCGRPLRSFDESYRTAFDFLGNPHKLWSSDRIEDKRTVLRLAFSEKLPYYRNEGFRTAQTSLPFRVLEGFDEGQSEMVRPTGIEPVTS